ncbi:MAG: M48 family metallopeptidase [Candidatus Limnocylindria bacterium]
MTSSPAPTTFYRQIGRNRRQSWLLVVSVLLVLAALGGAIGYATDFGWGGVVLALTFGVLGSIGAFFAGDHVVLASSGARRFDPAKPPEVLRQLVNVVSEMKLASGLPWPRLYTIDDTAPNAFATGRDPEHASIVVTRGLIEKLDREELQGVIAHEMSHVGNNDIRFALLVGVLVGSVALLSDWFLRFTFWGGGRRRDGDRGGGGGLLALIAVAALILAILAPLFSRTVQLAVSRTRESLADVSAVDLTRNPIGLASALRKIAADPEVLEVANRATQHLYIVNPIKSFEQRAATMWDTHPTIAERIRVLESLAGTYGPPVERAAAAPSP